MRRRHVAAIAAAAILTVVYFLNASWFAPVPKGTAQLLAHRGIHQTFKREGVTRDSCTAKQINRPTNPYLENTLPSMAASFAAGATIIELDVHPTTDGEFAVFHDWGLECRTNGKGVTRQKSLVYLKTLDVGYGYTADAGKTFPFRGDGVGMMPSLNEVLSAFPGKTFLINVKSRDPNESERLIAYLVDHGFPIDQRLWVFAEGPAYRRLRELAPLARLDSKQSLKSCTALYLAVGWTGHVPASCRNGSIAVPTNLRMVFWGWPNRFLTRMRNAGVNIMLLGPVGSDELGITDVDQLGAIPLGFSGTIMTDQIEVIGPEFKRRIF